MTERMGLHEQSRRLDKVGMDYGFFVRSKKGLRSTVAQERSLRSTNSRLMRKDNFLSLPLKMPMRRCASPLLAGCALTAACSSCCSIRMPPLSICQNGLSADAGRRLKTSTLAQGKPLLDLVSDGVFAEFCRPRMLISRQRPPVGFSHFQSPGSRLD